MAEDSAEFTTHATNFSDALSTGIDPKTGQLTLHFPLLHLSANCLSGPDINLSLNYSTLTMQDDYSIAPGTILTGITVLNTEKSSITLSTGDTWPVSGNKISFRKLKDCVLTYSDGVYQIHWKNGVTELLKKIGPAVYITKEIVSATGKKLWIDTSWNGRVLTVEKIYDLYATICTFTYTNTQIILNVWPGTSSEHHIIIRKINNLLSSVSRSVNDKAADDQTWIINHAIIESGEYKPIKILHPSGLVETIDYGSGVHGHQFPEHSGRKSLARVSGYKRFYGREQPAVIKIYSYSVRNFLGYGSSVNQFGNDAWTSNNDYIYRRLTDPKNGYVYSSTEKVTHNGVTHSIERTYNNYHQLIKEVREQNLCKTTKEISYYSEYGKDIEYQSEVYLHPSEQTITYSKIGYSSSREEKTKTKYDEYGNTLEIIYADGRIEKMTWYPVDGEKDFCPAEPKNLFISFLKMQELTPAPGDYKVPKTVILHTYEDIGGGHIMRVRSATYHDAATKDKLLHETIYSYNKSHADNDLYFGRLSSINEIIYSHDKTKINSFENNASIDYILNKKAGTLIHQVTRITHDKLTVSLEKTRSVYTGKLTKEVDYNGIISLYQYDKADRITKIKISDESSYSREKSWRYEIEKSPDEINGATETNSNISGPVIYYYDDKGHSFRSVLDGAGRLIRYDQLDTDLSGNWFPIKIRQYDAFGQISSETWQDWTTDDIKNKKTSPSISHTINYEYDDWGFLHKKSYSLGYVSVSDYDPISMIREDYCYKKSDKKITTGYKKTYLDIKKQPKKIELLDKQKNTISTTKYEWDGASLLRKYTDEFKEEIIYKYDLYGREITRKFPDESIVCRSYPAHLTHAFISEIGIKSGNVYHRIGHREFDGLSRLTKNTVGGRETQYIYTSENINKPTSIISPSGEKLCYEYVKELNDEILSIYDGEKASHNVFIHFDYDSDGNVKKSFRKEASHTENFYYKSGRLKQEKITISNKSFSTNHTYTLRGKRETFTDIYNQETKYQYDEYGRLKSINNSDISLYLNYDDFNRISARKSTSDKKNINLDMTISYDDFNREIQRTFTDSRKMQVDVALTRLCNGMISEKVTTYKDIKRVTEKYGYDNCLRLTDYTGDNLPNTSDGHKLTSCYYEYDVFNNITKVTSNFLTSSLIEKYIYNNKDDVTQLSAIQYSRSAEAPAFSTASLSYDEEGRVTINAASHTLSYNQTGRIKSVNNPETNISGDYKYDAYDRLQIKTTNDNTSLYFYCDNETVNIHTEKTKKEFLKLAHIPVGISTDNSASLLGGDYNASTFLCRNGNNSNETEIYINLPYGENIYTDLADFGFDGELIDVVIKGYHPGNGYRSYNPIIRRFEQPDDDSPFGTGGINCYAYCAGDPVNRTDPSGHTSVTGYILDAVMVASIAADLFSLGAAIPVTTAIDASAVAAIGFDSLALITNAAGLVSNHMLDPNVNLNGAMPAALTYAGVALTLIGVGFTYKLRQLNKIAYKSLIDTTEAVQTTKRLDLAGEDTAPLLAHPDETDAPGRVERTGSQTSLRSSSSESTQTSAQRTFSDGDTAPPGASGGDIPLELHVKPYKSQPVDPVRDPSADPGRPVVLTDGVNNAKLNEHLRIGPGKPPEHVYMHRGVNFSPFK